MQTIFVAVRQNCLSRKQQNQIAAFLPRSFGGKFKTWAIAASAWVNVRDERAMFVVVYIFLNCRNR
jgi:hypothetical protein